MTIDYGIKFNDGEPIDASSLQKMLTEISRIDLQSLKAPTAEDFAGDILTVGGLLTMGVSTNIEIIYEGTSITEFVPFAKPLIGTPIAVVATLQSANSDLDLVHYLKSFDNTGFTIAINRVAGINMDKGVATAFTGAKKYNVKVHYFALSSAAA